MRTGTSVVALILPLLAQLGTASADTNQSLPDGWHPMGKGFCGTTHEAPSAGPARLTSSHVLFLNRCTGGCTFTKSTVANAPTDVHAIDGASATVALPEFKNKAGMVGAMADTEWAAVMACVRETESYYNIQVVDTRPTSGGYHMAAVGGTGTDIGFSGSVNGGLLLGISQLACGGIDNVVSFSLAESSRLLTSSSDDYIRDVCKTIVHEAGHAFGLEHALRWVDDQTSTCSDPMSYDTATCDPSPAYFRNRIASCGTSFGGDDGEPYTCMCGVNNPHEKMLSVFGAGSPTVPPPTVSIVTPAAGGALASVVAASAGSKRGVAKVELYLNGWKWGEAAGAKFIVGGAQPNPSPYTFPLPSSVPNGKYDVEVRAYDDLGVTTTTASTAQKGAPCTDASACNAGQKCEEGKCFWDQPTAEIGDTCEYNEFCLSNLCQGTTETKICTRACIPQVADSCPADSGLECKETTPGKGICFLSDDDGGGCCRVSDESSDRTWLQAGLSLGVLGLLVTRRRRRK